MEVILREHVDNLGRRGDVVKVAPGYARNFLLPRKLALPVNDGNKRADRARAQARRSARARGAQQAEAVASRLCADRADAVPPRRRHRAALWLGNDRRHRRGARRKGLEIDRKRIHLDEPLKALGEFTVPVKLHRDVTAQLKVHVAKQELRRRRTRDGRRPSIGARPDRPIAFVRPSSFVSSSFTLSFPTCPTPSQLPPQSVRCRTISRPSVPCSAPC